MDEMRNTLTNIEAEMAALGSLLVDPSVIPLVVPLVKAEDFYEERHRAICAAIFMVGDGADILTVSTQLARQKVSDEQSGGAAYLAELTAAMPTALNAEHYAKIVADLATRRRMNAAATEIAKAAANLGMGVEDVLEKSQAALIKAANSANAGRVKNIREIVNEHAATYEQRLRGEYSGGLSWDKRLMDLDTYTEGLKPGKLYAIAARPGVGKSAFMAQVAMHAAITEKTPVAFFSAEMGEVEIADRIISNLAGIDIKTAKTHSDEQIKKVQSQQAKLAASPLNIFYAAGWTPARCIAECERLKSTSGLGLAIVDYIQILNVGADKGVTRDQALTAAMKGFKTIAGQLQIPIIVASQLNRGVNENDEPGLENMREAGLENDPDFVLMLWRPEKENPSLVNGKVAKNRDGKTGVLRFHFNQPLYRFGMAETVPLNE